MNTNDTIVAIATAPGRAGIGVVRVSGPLTPHIIKILCERTLDPRRATFASFRDVDGSTIDQGLALYFPSPHSSTGEDVVELHAHGSPVVLDWLVARITQLGARVAQPGEFSHRAFLNDKLDLAQAEAIADLIDSSSTQAARAAMRSLQGEFSRAVHAIVEQLIETRVYVEAAIDFPEEEVDLLNDERLLSRFDIASQQLHEVLVRAEQGALLRDGFKVVIAGKPNAGKSSLLNRLAGHDVAIVTDIPGTTRDVLRERVNIDGVMLELADTAGLRSDADVVEAEGIRRAHREVQSADHVMYVIDATDPPTRPALNEQLAKLAAGGRVTLVVNKRDLVSSLPDYGAGFVLLAVSAATGEGIAELKTHLKRIAGYQGLGENVILARRRHLDALQRAVTHVDAARARLTLQRAGELAAEELRQAQQALNEITGEFTSDDLLGRIFSSFCIGK